MLKISSIVEIYLNYFLVRFFRRIEWAYFLVQVIPYIHTVCLSHHDLSPFHCLFGWAVCWMAFKFFLNCFICLFWMELKFAAVRRAIIHAHFHSGFTFVCVFSSLSIRFASIHRCKNNRKSCGKVNKTKPNKAKQTYSKDE